MHCNAVVELRQHPRTDGIMPDRVLMRSDIARVTTQWLIDHWVLWNRRATNGIEAKEQADLLNDPLVHEQAIPWSAQSNRSKAPSFKVYEKAGTLRVSVQDVKNGHAAKEAMEMVVGSGVAA
jgi:hypothetical protein